MFAICHSLGLTGFMNAEVRDLICPQGSTGVPLSIVGLQTSRFCKCCNHTADWGQWDQKGSMGSSHALPHITVHRNNSDDVVHLCSFMLILAPAGSYSPNNGTKRDMWQPL